MGHIKRLILLVVVLLLGGALVYAYEPDFDFFKMGALIVVCVLAAEFLHQIDKRIFKKKRK